MNLLTNPSETVSVWLYMLPIAVFPTCLSECKSWKGNGGPKRTNASNWVGTKAPRKPSTEAGNLCIMPIFCLVFVTSWPLMNAFQLSKMVKLLKIGEKCFKYLPSKTNYPFRNLLMKPSTSRPTFFPWVLIKMFSTMRCQQFVWFLASKFSFVWLNSTYG